MGHILAACDSYGIPIHKALQQIVKPMEDYQNAMETQDEYLKDKNFIQGLKTRQKEINHLEKKMIEINT